MCRDAVGCLPWDVPMLFVPFLPVLLVAVYRCLLQDGVAGWWAVPALPFQRLVSVHGCLFRGLIRQSEILCAESEQENLCGHLSKCDEAGEHGYQDLLLGTENIKSSMCLRFSRCCISIIHFANSQTDQPLLRPRLRRSPHLQEQLFHCWYLLQKHSRVWGWCIEGCIA